MSTNDETPALQDRLFGMLGDLEDVETELVNRQAQLARELNAIEAELERITTIKAAIHGSRPKRRSGKRAGQPSAAGQSQPVAERRAQILAFAAQREGFTARELAEALGVSSQGIGPSIGAAVRDGDLKIAEEDLSARPILRRYAKAD